MTLTDTWTLSSGKLVTATATLITAKSINADGHHMEVACSPEINVTVNVDGHGYQGGNVRPMTAQELAKYPGKTHVCGKLAMTSEQADKVANLRAQLEAQPVWQQHLAVLAQRRTEVAAYDAHRAKMAKVMGY